MKRTIICLCAFCAALVSCSKQSVDTINEGKTITVVASATTEEAAKACLGELSDSKYPILWNDVEKAALDEFVGTAKSQEVQASAFVKDPQSDSKGNFTFVLDEKEGDTFDYFAITPGKNPGETTNPTHGWRACKTGNISYIVNHTVDQIPLADRPDPTTHVMVASVKGHQGQAETLTLDFKPVVGYGKMTITNFPALAQDETVTKITITTPAGKYLSGRYYEDIQTGERTPYNASNVKNYVTINPQNITFNTTGFDVWFTCHTVDLAKDDILSVKVETSAKTYEGNLKISKALSFKAGVVSAFTYNWTKSQPQAETRTVTFDFSACPSGWPSGSAEYKSKEHQEKFHTYTVDGVDYVFSTGVCTDVASTSTRSICWGYNGTADCEMFIIQAQRYFGLPALAGWKLIEIKFPQALGSNSGRMIGITDHICENGKQEYIATVPEGAQACKTQGTVYTFTLTSSAANTRYYMAASNKGTGLTTITLTYEKVE